MNGFWMRVDQELIARRERRPWLAEATGISLGRINNWYVRDTLPRADDSVRIAKVLQTTVRYLVTGDQSDVLSGLPDQLRHNVEILMKMSGRDRTRALLLCRAVLILVTQGALDVPLETYLNLQQEETKETPPSFPRQDK